MNWEVEELLSAYEKDSSNVIYELYAILIHKGTATSGHYLSFIKDVSDGKWYKFNDTQVTSLELVDLVKAFGAKPQTRKSRFS